MSSVAWEEIWISWDYKRCGVSVSVVLLDGEIVQNQYFSIHYHIWGSDAVWGKAFICFLKSFCFTVTTSLKNDISFRLDICMDMVSMDNTLWFYKLSSNLHAATRRWRDSGRGKCNIELLVWFYILSLNTQGER